MIIRMNGKIQRTGFHPGDRVVFSDANASMAFPDYFPPVGTIGTVERLIKGGKMLCVSWNVNPEIQFDRNCVSKKQVQRVWENE